MALPDPKDLEYIKQLIEEIKASGGDIPTGLEVVNIKSSEDALKAIRILQSAVKDVDKTFGSINARLQNIVEEITKSHKPINIATSSYRKLESQLRKIQIDMRVLSEKLSEQKFGVPKHRICVCFGGRIQVTRRVLWACTATKLLS